MNESAPELNFWGSLPKLRGNVYKSGIDSNGLKAPLSQESRELSTLPCLSNPHFSLHKEVSDDLAKWSLHRLHTVFRDHHRP